MSEEALLSHEGRGLVCGSLVGEGKNRWTKEMNILDIGLTADRFGWIEGGLCCGLSCSVFILETFHLVP
jgi:hypothetical protein